LFSKKVFFFIIFHSKISKFLKYGFGIEIPNFAGLFVQFMITLLLEWSPLLFGIVYGIVSGDFQIGLQAFISGLDFGEYSIKRRFVCNISIHLHLVLCKCC
jgi:hypothetical protein